MLIFFTAAQFLEREGLPETSMLFPSGRPPSPLEKRAAAVILGIALFALLVAFHSARHRLQKTPERAHQELDLDLGK